jgi:hypothetical protein
MVLKIIRHVPNDTAKDRVTSAPFEKVSRGTLTKMNNRINVIIVTDMLRFIKIKQALRNFRHGVNPLMILCILGSNCS